MNRCRYAWYERGAVRRHVAGWNASTVPADEPRHPARLTTMQGIVVVDAVIDGVTWYGRLMPRKNGASDGSVLLFERNRTPADQRR